jgi:hypothetical protein
MNRINNNNLKNFINNLFNKITYSQNSGNSQEDAIKILGAKNTFEGIDAEYKYISTIYGKENEDWRLLSQALLVDKGKQIDHLKILLKSGERAEFYFDVSDFFGR